MTHFEYVTVAYSIVIALCIARCLDAIPSSIRAPQRYWVHTTWVLIKLANTLVLWWVVWRFRAEDWTYLYFITLLLPPVLVYLQIIFLVTTEPHTVENWRSHFYGQRHQFFLLNALLNIILFAGNLQSPTPEVLVSVAQAGLFAGSIAAAVSGNEKVHIAFALYTALVNFVGFSLAMSA